MDTIPVVLDHFNTGAIGDETMGHVSSEWYQSALQTAQNVIIPPYGNLRKRPGSIYIAGVSGSQYKMIPFVYSQAEAYVLLLIMDNAGVANDNRIYFLTQEGYIENNGTPYYIALNYADTVNLETIQWIQKDDVIYLACAGQPLQQITRNSQTSWTMATAPITLKYIVAYGNGTSATAAGVLPVSLISPGDIILYYTINGVTYSVTDNGSGKFVGTDLVNSTVDYATGRISIQTTNYANQTLQVWLGATAYSAGAYILASNGGVYTATVGGTTASTPPTWTYTIGATNTDGGVTWKCVGVPFDVNTPIYVQFTNYANFYPAVIGFYEDRLILGNLPGGAQVIAGSVTGSYTNFTFGTADNDAYIYEVASTDNNQITWIVGGNFLFIGTLGAEYLANGGVSGITPTSISVQKQSAYGSAPIVPIYLGICLVFLQMQQTRVYDFSYMYLYACFVGSDLCMLNRGILQAGVKEMYYELLPYSRILTLLNDGTMAILTYNKMEQIAAWQTYVTNGTIQTIATIPSSTGEFSQTYMVVERGGQAYVEATDNPIYTNYFDNVYVDCAIRYNGASTSSIPVPYPNGTTVSILTGTGVHPDTVVANGAVSLNWAVTQASIGYSYTYEVNTVPVEVVINHQFTSLYKPKQIKELRVYLDKSLGGEFGINDQYQMLYRTANNLMDNILPLFSGVKPVWLYNPMMQFDQFYVSIVHDQPLPFNLLAIAMDVAVGQL